MFLIPIIKEAMQMAWNCFTLAKFCSRIWQLACRLGIITGTVKAMSLIFGRMLIITLLLCSGRGKGPTIMINTCAITKISWAKRRKKLILLINILLKSLNLFKKMQWENAFIRWRSRDQKNSISPSLMIII